MSEETPKLYTNKPKKAQLKQSTGTAASSSPASPAAASYRMGSHSTAPPPPPHPPPPPQKESFAKRYKFLWPLLLTVNLAVGGYLFMRTSKKDTDGELKKETNGSSAQVSSPTISTAPLAEKTISSSPTVTEPREPIPEHQQRELFKWILEEKRKVKPKDPEEKKRIDEEKAILKEFIRAKNIPKI